MTTEQLTRVEMIQLVSLRAAVKLEARGMKRSRRPSAKTIACQKLGLPKRSTYDEVITAITVKLESCHG